MNGTEQRKRHTVTAQLKQDFTDSLNQIIPQINGVLATEQERNDERYRKLEESCVAACTKLAETVNYQADCLTGFGHEMEIDTNITIEDFRKVWGILGRGFWGRLNWVVRGK